MPDKTRSKRGAPARPSQGGTAVADALLLGAKPAPRYLTPAEVIKAAPRPAAPPRRGRSKPKPKAKPKAAPRQGILGAYQDFVDTALDANDTFVNNLLPNLGDEIRGTGRGIRALANGEDFWSAFDEGQADFDADQERFAEESPYLHGAATATGFVGGMTLPAGKVVSGATRGQKAAQGARWGAGYGALAGAADGEGLQERATNAAIGAPIGASVGYVAPGLIDDAIQAAPGAYRVMKDIAADTSGELRLPGRSIVPEASGAQAPKRPARHYSFAPNLTETDPSMWGTNKTPGFISREERQSMAVAPGRTFFGLDGGSQPYSKEKGVGPYEYEADLGDFNLLDLGTGGAVKHTEMLEALPETYRGREYNGRNYRKRIDLIEQLIKDDGYDGYTSTNPVLGDVASMFSPVPVRRVQQPLEGAPTKLGPYDPLRHLTTSYMERQGLPANVQQRYAPADPEFHTKAAQAFEDMPHNPADPEVAEAYEALSREALQQLDELEKAGYKFSFLDPENDPYPSPFDAIRDLRDNKRMQVYPTDAGFGSGAGLSPEDIANNPLLRTVPDRTWDGKPITYNDAFRAVHDAFGHAKEGFGFRADGENAAYLQHLPTFSPAAQRALATETLGQNSWVNFGPHGQANRTASAGDTVFADQKNGLLPDDIVFGGQAGDFMPDPRTTSYGRRDNPAGRGNARTFNEEGLQARLSELGNPLPERTQPAIVDSSGRPGEAYSNPSLISTRRPSPANYGTQGNPDEELLIQTGQSLKDAPDALAKNMGILRQEPFMQGAEGSPEELYDEAVRRGADNMRYIAEELMPPELVDASRGWYKTANGFAGDMADKYGISDEQASGVLAALSPQNHWANNVANAEQLLQLRQGGFDGSHLGEQAARLASDMANQGSRKKNAIALLGPKKARQIMETPFEELDKVSQRHKIAMLAELELDNTLYDIAPDGTKLGPMGRVSFGSSNEVNAALQILDGTEIGKVLAGGGKVPTFYNNIVDPDAPLPLVTTDTHHAGAFSLFPGGGDDTIVKLGMGRGAGSNSAKTGSKGIYGLIADSTALAGEEMGMLPREVQSVVWEGARGVWGGPGMKTPALKKAIAEAWQKSGSPEAARKNIKGILSR